MELENRLGMMLANDDPFLLGFPTLSGDVISRYRRRADGKTCWERERHRKWSRPSLEFGERVFVREATERINRLNQDCEPQLISVRCVGRRARIGAVNGLTSGGVKSWMLLETSSREHEVEYRCVARNV